MSWESEHRKRTACCKQLMHDGDVGVLLIGRCKDNGAGERSRGGGADLHRQSCGIIDMEVLPNLLFSVAQM